MSSFKDDDRFTEVARQYQGTVSGFCRNCRETEIFDRYQVTLRDEVTEELETQHIRVCQGCGHEEGAGLVWK